MNPHEAYALLVKRLAGAGIESAQAEAWQLLEAATGRQRVELLAQSAPLGRQVERQLGEWSTRRELREPLQLILGRSHFYGLELQVEPGVLIPRPETERLVELALEQLREIDRPMVMDLGTGTGAVALALSSERPDATVLATDNSPAALALCSRNAQALSLPVEAIESDLLAAPAAASFARQAQLIVSNPPYLPDSDRAVTSPEVGWDPEQALYAGVDGLDLFRRLQAEARDLLRVGAALLVELDPRNVEEAASIATGGGHGSGWSDASVHEDLTGRRRFLLLRR